MAVLQWDLSKPDNSTIIRLQDYFTGRQGDSNSHVTMQFLDSVVNGKPKPHVFNGDDSVYLKANNTDRTDPIHIYGTATVTNAALGLVDFYFPAGTFKNVGNFDAFFGINDGQGTTVSAVNCVLEVCEDFVDAYINVDPYEDMFATWLTEINKSYADNIAKAKALYSDNSDDADAIKQGLDAYQKAIDALNAQIKAGDIPTTAEIETMFKGAYEPIVKVTKVAATLLNCTSDSSYCYVRTVDLGAIKLAIFSLNLKVNKITAGTAFAQFPAGTIAGIDGTGFLSNDLIVSVDNKNDALKVHLDTAGGEWAFGSAISYF